MQGCWLSWRPGALVLLVWFWYDKNLKFLNNAKHKCATWWPYYYMNGLYIYCADNNLRNPKSFPYGKPLIIFEFPSVPVLLRQSTHRYGGHIVSVFSISNGCCYSYNNLWRPWAVNKHPIILLMLWPKVTTNFDDLHSWECFPFDQMVA